MVRYGCAGIVFVLVSGCAISDVNRMNQQLKKENSELLAENRELKARAESFRKDVVEKQMEIERLKEEMASNALGKASAKLPPDAPRGAFDKVPDVEVVEGEGQTRVILSNQIFFSPGSCQITERGKKTLNQVGDIINEKYRGKEIRIEGHTDDTAINVTRDKYASNWELSCDRACAVLRYLEGRNVPPTSMHAAGFAFYKAVAANATESGRQKNRRVEIVIFQ